MRRYIDADKLPRHGRRGGLVYWRDIEAQPTADVVPMDFHDRCMEIEIQKRMNMVEVVRCKDCKYYTLKPQQTSRVTSVRRCNRSAIVCTKPDDFCSFGERIAK